ncbi:PLP-dependent transferase [Nakamurella flavida]|uniref:homocysteine desulfhydrase n=1 Tax=Nakamurella flavida TaxID=363630 RepID=A0A938YG31_9ACTN|nr:PLP-dependent aspartate aminotransferase family protein [Nakamurella flavida]MBM9477035.1 PLP-dependent transferase [Nakamurella flavida]MDP9779981.1 methionine-gamma-lyase [Nakamurella flavida]
MTDPKLALSTRAVHVPAADPVGGRPLSVPIYQTSVFAHDDAKTITDALNDPRGDFAYSRLGNPTVRALEHAMAELEGAAGAVATASGMGAIAVALGAQLRAGSHLVVQRSIYGGTTGLLDDLVARWGLSTTEVDGDDPAALRAALRPNTVAVYLETISNPMTVVADLPAMCAVAREAGVLTVVDSTFASPMVCRPLELGADIVVHSATKYLSGHSDVTGGITAYADEKHFRAGWAYAATTGVTPDPFATWLIIRGLQTLGLRMRQANSNAVALAETLAAHPAVDRVHHPSRPDHPQHELARRILDGYGAMLSFDLAAGEHAARAFTASVRLIQQAASLGGVETLTVHPSSTSHRSFSDEALAAAGISRGTVRLSVGIEDPADLVADLTQALEQC